MVSVEGVTCLEWCPARSTCPAVTRVLAASQPERSCVCSFTPLARGVAPAGPSHAGLLLSLLSTSPRLAWTVGLAQMDSSPSVRHNRMPSFKCLWLCRKGVTLCHLPGPTVSHAASGQ